MKILLALDGSPCSDAALREVIRRDWPDGTEVEVLSVAHAFPQIPDPMMLGAAAHADSLERTRSEARKVVEKAARALAAEAPALRVTTKILDGAPKAVVVEEAETWHPDLLVLGSHGRGMVKRILLGSVSHAAALHAPCSVEIVRCPAWASEEKAA